MYHMDPVQQNKMLPTMDASHNITDEALDMLEAYLQFESLEEAVVLQESDNVTARGDSETGGQSAKPKPYSGLLVPPDMRQKLLSSGSCKMFGLWDPMTRRRDSQGASPRPIKSSGHQCALCGKDVNRRGTTSRSALSAHCSPERRVQLDTRNSLPFGCERSLHPDRYTTAEQEQNNAASALSHTEETSDIEELMGPYRVPLIHLPNPESQSQSACDKMDGIDPFQRQQSSFSTSTSLEPYSLPNSGLPSRTPSQLKACSLVQSMFSSYGENQSASVIRSHSTGINVLQKQSSIQPSVRWPPSVVSTTSGPYQYSRCDSVHSAPGDGRNRVREKTKRESVRKWFRFSLPKVRKYPKPPDASRTTDSLSATPIVSQTETSKADEKMAAVAKGPKTSRAHLGLESLFHLIPRWFRGHEDDESPDPYVPSGFTVRLRRSVFGNAQRRRRKAHDSKRSAAEPVIRAPRLSPIYIPDRLSGHYVRTKTSTTVPPTNGIAPHSPSQQPGQPAGAGTPQSTTYPASPTVLSEVSRVYEEIIHTAEGGRLGESTVQVWRTVTDKTVASGEPTGSDVSHPEGSLPPVPRSRPLSSIDETCSTGPDRLSGPPRPDHIAACHAFFIPSNSTTPEPTFLSKFVVGSASQMSQSKSSNSSGDSSIVFSPPPPKHPHESAHSPEQSDQENQSQPNVQNYAVYVAAMIDVLSQRIMNQISEDDLELRLQRLEMEATAASLLDDSAGGSVHTNNSGACQRPGYPLPESTSTGADSAPLIHTTNQRKASVVVESHTIERVLLAQVRRLEHRNKLDIQVDLLNHLPQHTEYTSFEADMLRLLGRKPSWHHIAILYYLARCTVRHVLKTHLAELDSLQRSVDDSSSQPRVRSTSSAKMLVELDQIERKISSIGPGPTELGSLPGSVQDSLLREIGRCRARVERVKDFTITFFTRWYADWVSKHGGWWSLMEDAADSEID